MFSALRRRLHNSPKTEYRTLIIFSAHVACTYFHCPTVNRSSSSTIATRCSSLHVATHLKHEVKLAITRYSELDKIVDPSDEQNCLLEMLTEEFQSALLQRWVLANFMCSLAPMVQVISVNVSIFTLTVIAVDRYIAVMHPFHAGCSQRSAAIIISITWVVAVSLAMPYAMFYWVDYVEEPDTDPKYWCNRHEPPGLLNFFYYFSSFLIALQYLFPLTVICFCYCRIAWHIWGSRRPGAHVDTEDLRGRNKRKVVKMMIIVVCLFVLCWLPLQTYNFLDVVDDRINEYKYINIIWFCSNWLAMSNSCYNPFIYGILNAKFKREFRHLFSVFPCKCLAQPAKDFCSGYHSEDIRHQQYGTRRGNHRHGAMRYNLTRDEARSLFPLSGNEMTETSQI